MQKSGGIAELYLFGLTFAYTHQSSGFRGLYYEDFFPPLFFFFLDYIICEKFRAVSLLKTHSNWGLLAEGNEIVTCLQ